MLSAESDVKQCLLNSEDSSTTFQLPGDGLLVLDHEIPFLLLHIRRENESAIERLVKNSASFLIIDEEQKELQQEIIETIANQMAGRFGTFLILQVQKGKTGSNSFVISGQLGVFPATVDALQNELSNIKRKWDESSLKVSLNELDEQALENNIAANSPAQYLQLSVPPVFENEEGAQYPLYFRRFKKSFTRAIQGALYEFARVQTTCSIHSFALLGRSELNDITTRIDNQLCEIQHQYQFLMLVAPTNITDIRERFFKSNFKEVDDYHYRMLPIDPDVLKRQLYNLEIEQIDDPALNYLFDDKREEIDLELSMLKERGTEDFFYRSVRLYHTPSRELVKVATEILDNVQKGQLPPDCEPVSIKAFEEMVEEEFDYFKKQSPEFSSKVHIRDDVNIMMVHNGEFYLPANARLNSYDATSLLQHEIGTHVLTYFNGSQQPIRQLSTGLASYDALQEGIAVMSEYFSGALTANRLRTIAGRVIAGDCLVNGADFTEMFDTLYNTYHFSKEDAFNTTSRMFQGGGFLKDIVYLRGLVEAVNYVKEGGNVEKLLAGKFALKHLEIIDELTDKKVLKPAEIKPRYLTTEDFNKKTALIKEGLPIYKMKIE